MGRDPSAEPASVLVRDLGRVPYAEALALQQDAVAARRSGTAPDTLFLLEHPPVVTLGRGAGEEHLLESPAELAKQGIEVHRVARGGDVTWHGPGQLVGYPVLDLAARDRRDVHLYLRDLEGVLCEALAELSVPACTVPGRTGVFVADADAAQARKIASIGVGLRGWVTYPGFALNVDVDLAGFACMVACGLHDVEMTSIARELGESSPDLGSRAREAVTSAFRRRFVCGTCGPWPGPLL